MNMSMSIFDLFRVGIGPSSSHTVGPMRAAKSFVETLCMTNLLGRTVQVKVDLYGSLALTGRGHGTDRAVLLGLEGESPDQIDPAIIEQRIGEIRERKELVLNGQKTIPFFEERDLQFHGESTLPKHSNGMRFSAFSASDARLREDTYYSVGGGFIVADGQDSGTKPSVLDVPFPFNSAAELLDIANKKNLPIWAVVFENEKTWRTEDEIRLGIQGIWNAMQQSARRGLMAEGVLPGGLNVRRRASGMYQKIISKPASDPAAAMDWLTVHAIAVSEENAAGGRVVTAPTNGAAGVMPAVAHYYQRFAPGASADGVLRYFLTAGAIGILYKENASISGAEVGCQGEVGVAASMAAAGLVAAYEGTNAQVEHAAEIAMEHHLGMTCDPIAGLVQIPCIERNAMGAIKALNACRLAIGDDGDHKVSLDQVIRTMYQTGLDMQSRYKETSLAGLAVNVAEC
jgi:L-serine dehydratase